MSTPIETNTEDLRVILQAVYDLKNAGSGSSAPDLVIGFDDTNWEGVNGPDQFTYDHAEVIATYNKILTKQPVNCVMNAIYWPHSGGPITASSPHVTAFAVSEAGNSARAGFMRLFFNFWREYNLNGYWTFFIEFSILGDGTATITNASFTGTCQFSSLIYPSS